MTNAPISLPALRGPRVRLERGWLDLDRGVFTSEEGVVQLTAIEIKLIRVLLASGHEPVSRDALHVEVWGYSPKVQTRAADQAVKRLRKKLERDPGVPRHLQTAHGVGYRFIPEQGTPPLTMLAAVSQVGCPTNLARHTTSLVGRQHLIARLDAWFEGSDRMATLLGPGGIGKTSLARVWGEARTEGGGAVSGGIWFCDLVGVEVQALMIAKITRDVGLKVTGTVDPEVVGRALATRGPMLLIVDNLETLLPQATRVLKKWLLTAPNLKILATSRVRIGVPEELCIDVPPLDHRASGDLLTQRIRAVSSRALVADDVARLAVALEGIPLAIELAAARCSLLSPREILERLNARLDVLARAGVDSDDRHATLRASLSSSWSMLSDHEQDLLRQCVVFRGGFDLEAAEAVLQPLGQTAPTFEILQQLRDHSLIRIVPGSGSVRTRVAMLEFVRAFVGEQEAQHDEAALAVRHADFYATRSEDCVDPNGHSSWSSTDPLVPDIENLRAAAERAGDFDEVLAVRVLLARVRAIRDRGLAAEAIVTTRAALRRARDADEMPPDLLSRAWCCHGGHTQGSDADDEGEAAIARGIEIADAHGRHARAVLARMQLVKVRYLRGEFASAWPLIEQAIPIASAHAPHLVATIDYQKARIHAHAGDLDQAEEHAQAALAQWRRQGDRTGEATAQHAVGYMALQRGKFAAAEAAFLAAIEAFEEVGDDQAAGLQSLVGLVAMEQSQLDRAAQIMETSAEWCRRTGSLQYLAEDLSVLGYIALLRDDAETAQRHLQQAVNLFGRGLDRNNEFDAQVMLALALAHSGKVAVGRAKLATCKDTRPPGNLHQIETLLAIVAVLIDGCDGVPDVDVRAAELHATLTAGPPLATVGSRVGLRLLGRTLVPAEEPDGTA